MEKRICTSGQGIGFKTIHPVFIIMTLIIALAVNGCATPAVQRPTSTRILQPDQEDDIGGTFMESGDIRTVASRMTGSLLSAPEIAMQEGLVRVAIAPIRNSTRFIVDKDIFMKRLRIEMNKNSQGRIRFFSQGMGQKVRQEILRGQDEDIWDEMIEEVAAYFTNSWVVAKATEQLKVAVIPIENTNIVGLNADSFTALIRAGIAEKAQGKIAFLAREENGKVISQILAESDLRNLDLVESIRNNRIAGVDYFLGGEFIAKSLSVESAVKETKAAVGSSKEDPRILSVKSETSVKRPNVTTYLNMMLINAQTGVVPVEKLAKVERKMKTGLARANYLLTGELSALSKAAAGGDRSDYIIMSFQLVDPQTNEVVWEDVYETKKVSNKSVLYK